jgi:hypothetical protein
METRSAVRDTIVVGIPWGKRLFGRPRRGCIILKGIINRQDLKLTAGFYWLRIGTSTGTY